MTPINCLHQMQNSTYQSTLSQAAMEVFQSAFIACSNPASCSLTPDIYLQSVRSHRRPEGWRGARWRETNRDTQQHNVKVKRNTSHQCIRLLLR
ncbi:hypothetical protein ABVT39_006056 [Epinephelus coioides]